MNNYQAVLFDNNGNSGVYTGHVKAGKVETSAVLWNAPIDQIAHTREYRLFVNGEEPFSLSGDAYRNLDECGCMENLELLAVLDMPSAVQVASFAEQGANLFRSLVTTDATLSCSIFTVTDDEEKILAEAKEMGLWEVNDCNPIDDIYFAGGAKEDIEEVSLDQLVCVLLGTARAKAKVKAEAKALDLAKRIARVDACDFLKDGSSSNHDGCYQALMTLIDQAKELTELIA